MRRLIVIAAVAFALAGAWYWNSTRAAGVSGRAIRQGKQATGTLSDQDPRLRGRGPYQMWKLNGKRGQRIVIDMASSSFDTYLMLRTAEGILLARDDDGGDGNNARIRTILPRSGTYGIVATSYGAAANGDYSLTVGEWLVPDAPAAGQAQALTMGQTRDGLLEPGDDLTGDGPYQDRWTFELAEGARFRVEMRSSDIDAYLILLGPGDTTLATNDDGSGRDAVIAMRAARAGRYTALATTYGDMPVVGAYRIALSEVTGEIGGAPVTISLGETKDGSLEAGDSTGSNGSPVDLFLFTAPSTRMYQIDLVSTAVDPYLTLQDAVGNMLTTDDDGGDTNLDARIRFQMQQGQRYRIVAGTFGSGRSGPYRLSVNPAP
ncbi:MAG: hypothetical protein A2085_04130 [Gemmatimonadetes bacterium GWC2_71_10]|nr:MAG: hypothetical protein A2085_04130 [Gemmatimonadetes bacterium GWC2_71_10]